MSTAKMIAKLVEAGHEDLADDLLVASNPGEDFLHIKLPIGSKAIYSFDELKKLAEKRKNERVKEQGYTSAKIVNLKIQILGSDVKLLAELKVSGW